MISYFKLFGQLSQFHSNGFVNCREMPPVKKDKQQSSGQAQVVDKVAHFVPYQDILAIDWNLEDFAARVKKTQPGIFAIFGMCRQFSS